MKTLSTSAQILFTFALILTIGIFSASAQNHSRHSVMAISQNDNTVKSSSFLQIAVHALEAASPKFLIGLVNTGSEPVTIRLKDSEGQTIYKPIFFHHKSLVATFDMANMQDGTYTIEVRSKSETYRYQVQLENKVMRTVEISPTIVAKVK
jgi:hypothetical protein